MIATYEAIAQRAYEIWEREGYPVGSDQEHWFRAERELRSQATQEQETKPLLTNEPALLKPIPPSSSAPKRGIRPVADRPSRTQARSRL